MIFKTIAEEQNPYTDEEWRAHNSMGHFSKHIAIALLNVSLLTLLKDFLRTFGPSLHHS